MDSFNIKKAIKVKQVISTFPDAMMSRLVTRCDPSTLHFIIFLDSTTVLVFGNAE